MSQRRKKKGEEEEKEKQSGKGFGPKIKSGEPGRK